MPSKIKKARDLIKTINHTRSDNIRMAFVLFRSMEGRERALHAYRKKAKTFREKLHGCLCFVCTNTCFRKKVEEKEEDEALKFMGKFEIVVEAADDPEHVLW